MLYNKKINKLKLSDATIKSEKAKEKFFEY